MHKYTNNYKLKIKHVLKAKALAKNLLSSQQLDIQRRKLILLEEITRQSAKALEIMIKTTGNVNNIARDIAI
jgi:hypothetical protein